MAESTNVFSLLSPEWLEDIPGVGYDEEFWDIINFYLLHSLCDEQSWKGHTISSEYLWKAHPWRPDSYLKDKIIQAIWGRADRKLFMAEKRTSYQSMLEGKNLGEDFYLNTYEQRAGYVKVSKGKGNSGEIMGLFYHIRNSFAHGRYGCVPIEENDYMIFMEDGRPFNGQFEVTARIALRKSSLMRIREVIMNGPDHDPEYALEIIASMRDGNKTKKSIMADLDISESIWKKYSHQLKIKNQIIYDRNRKIWKLNE